MIKKTDVLDLIVEIRTQLAEDERVALAASPGPWSHGNDGLVWSSRIGDPVSGSTEVEDAAHIVRWNPARVLAEIKAKRQLLDCLVGATNRGTSRLIANDEPWAIGSDDLVKVLAGPTSTPSPRSSGARPGVPDDQEG